MNTFQKNCIYSALLTAGLITGPAQAAQVITQDLVVQGSTCTGFDCVNGESFGFDTLRLKENNLRIHFDDTSNTASFPSTDWRLSANDTSNGGANRFSIEDATAGRTPFTIQGGSINHAMFIDSEGDVGLGTNNPVVELHAVDGNTPTLRIEQNGSNGFTPQTWDLAGNETNFFIRDATNGSTLPFRIRLGAPTSAIDIAGDGDVGMGTSSPGTDLHIRNTTNTTSVRIEATGGGATSWDIDATDTSGAFESGDYARLSSNSTSAALEMSDTGRTRVYNDLNSVVFEIANEGSFTLTRPGVGTRLFFDSFGGNLTVEGNGTFNGAAGITAASFNPPSSRAIKEEFEPINRQDVLRAVSELEISEWSYKQSSQIRHIGPFAEDFYAAFGLGNDAQHIATIDSDGIALASIQALHENQLEKDKEIEALKGKLEDKDQQLQALSERLQRLEKALSLTASVTP